MNYYLKIADTTFQIEASEPFEIADNIRHFFVEEENAGVPDVRYKVCIDSVFQPFEGRILYQKPDRVILQKENCEYRLHLAPEVRYVYAYYQETKSRINEIHILDSYLTKNIFTIVFLEFMALEKYLLQKNALILHSSYIIHGGKAIVFSAPSGTGKSTQASLWEQYMGATVINGDRSILRLEKEEVRAYSLPFCGSSGINLNESAPLVGIVLIEQATENVIESYPKASAIKKIFSECSVNYWNSLSAMESLDMIEKIVEKVPVYRLKCTISKEAVDLVYKEIF